MDGGGSYRGWIFDLYPGPGGMVVWLVDADGRSIRLEDPFQPPFYVRGNPRALSALARELGRAGLARPVGMAKRREFWTGERIEALEFRLLDPEKQPALLKRLAEPRPGLTLYDCDLPLPLLYGHARGIFPLARCEVARAGDGTLVFRLLEDRWDLHYTHPPLVVLELVGSGDDGGRDFPFGILRRLEARCQGTEIAIEEGDPAALVAEINDLLRRFDPHLILTDWGDSYLFPALFRLAARAGSAVGGLELDRDAVRRRLVTQGRSFFSYGRILYMAPSYPLFGRWHLDKQNSFLLTETGLEGLLELARLSRTPVQKLARTTPGTAITALQLDRALDEGILVPWKKGEPERWKTALDLLVTDKGGLVYYPRLGVYQDVAEIDFASMYPSLMVRHNISPETVGCRCCADNPVPEIGTWTCRRHEGLVPATLRPILDRRAGYKRLMRQATGEVRDAYHMRQTALKWILVTCFGYLGYRNARFGRIEAHEAVTAWSREKLLRAKEACEARGFTMLHAIVDSVWVWRAGATEVDYRALCRAIVEATDLPLALEGIYRWIAFLPSRTHPTVGVPNRFVGAFRDGSLKIRGIELRRHDTPPLIAAAQRAMLDALAPAAGAEDLKTRVPDVFEILADYALRLGQGIVPIGALAIQRTVSQEAGEYQHDTQLALALKQLQRAGITVHPGEQIAYVILKDRAKIKDERVSPLALCGPDAAYDADKYIEMLVQATATLLGPLGYTREHLQTYLAHLRRFEFPCPTVEQCHTVSR